MAIDERRSNPECLSGVDRRSGAALASGPGHALNSPAIRSEPRATINIGIAWASLWDAQCTSPAMGNDRYTTGLSHFADNASFTDEFPLSTLGAERMRP